MATGGKDGVLRIWKTLDKGGEPSKLFCFNMIRLQADIRLQPLQRVQKWTSV